MLEIFKLIFIRLGDLEMLLWNTDLTDSLRENADKNRFFLFVFFVRLSEVEALVTISKLKIYNILNC